MLPLGLILLADDFPPLRSMGSRILDWIERRYPQWLAASAASNRR
jgi:predicted DNA-binding transcriptional regulator AlpA